MFPLGSTSVCDFLVVTRFLLNVYQEMNLLLVISTSAHSSRTSHIKHSASSNWSPSFRGRFPLPWSKLSSKIVLRLLVGCQITKVRSRIWFRSLYHLLYCSPIFLATRELFLTRSRSLCRFLLLRPIRTYVASHDRCDVIRQHQVLFSRVGPTSLRCLRLGRKSPSTHRASSGRVCAGL